MAWKERGINSFKVERNEVKGIKDMKAKYGKKNKLTTEFIPDDSEGKTKTCANRATNLLKNG